MKIAHYALVFVACALAAPTHGQESDVDANLKTLTINYQNQIERALAPIHARHLAALKDLEQRYTRTAKLDAAIQIRHEYTRIKAWQESLAVTIHPKDPSKDPKMDLAVWLPGKRFEFMGASGLVKLEFSETTVTYIHGSVAPKVHKYEITAPLELQFGSTPFIVKLRSSFRGGTFQSSRGTYDLNYKGGN